MDRRQRAKADMDNNWNINKELSFIRKIGTGVFGTVNTRVRSKSRKELLIGYIKGSRLRERWDGMDKDIVIGFAEECLRQYLIHEEE